MLQRLVVGTALFLAPALAQAGTPGTWQGEQRGLVVLLEWSNVQSPVTREQIEEAFFSEGDGARSARQFFLENSSGSFDLSGEVLDWRKSSRSWWSDGGCDLDSIVEAAWAEFGADIDVAKYDADGNGKIDNFFVVHSGRIASDRVGPECTFTQYWRADHTIVFQSQGLGSIGQAIPVGFYIHEGGHGYYGLPDLYGDHYHGRYGIAMWGMMGLGAWGTRNSLPQADLFRVPAHFEPYSKVRIGWVKPRLVDTTTIGVVIKPVETDNDIVAVPLGGGSNYYLEYRSARGFSTEHHGHGLLIWRNYDLVQADGRDDLNNGNNLGYRPLPPIAENFGDDTDPFPGADQVTQYSDAGTGVSFENIRQYDDRIELDIVLSFAPGRAFTLDPRREVFDGVERL